MVWGPTDASETMADLTRLVFFDAIDARLDGDTITTDVGAKDTVVRARVYETGDSRGAIVRSSDAAARVEVTARGYSAAWSTDRSATQVARAIIETAMSDSATVRLTLYEPDAHSDFEDADPVVLPVDEQLRILEDGSTIAEFELSNETVDTEWAAQGIDAPNHAEVGVRVRGHRPQVLLRLLGLTASQALDQERFAREATTLIQSVATQ